METTEIPTVGQVVGRSLAELRAQRRQTQREAAEFLRAHGLPWTAANVASLESGRRESLDVATLTLLAYAYDVPPSRLFQGDGEMRLSAEATVDLREYRDWLNGQKPLTVTVSGAAARRLIRSLPGETISFHADAEVAARLGLKPEDVYRAAQKLWGRTLHQERERRLAEAGDLTPSQRRTRRGHITRRLVEELKPYLGVRS